MASTYTLISSQVLASSAASVTFSSIPATYTDLVLRCSVRTDDSARTLYYMKTQFNGDTGTNYSTTDVYSYSSAAASVRTTSYNDLTGDPYTVDGPNSTASTFSNLELYIPSYTASQNKPVSLSTAVENNSATLALIGASANLWRSTAAITSITFTSYGNFVTNSSFYLYGISNA